MWGKTELTRRRCRDTGLVILCVLLVVNWYWKSQTFLLPAIVLCLVTLLWPLLLKPVAFLWFALADILGTVVTRCLLTGVFLLVVLPLGLLGRMMGKDVLLLKRWKQERTSVFVDRGQSASSDDLKYPF